MESLMLEIGEISHGTLRNQDIASAMLPLAREVGLHPGTIGELMLVAESEVEDSDGIEIINEVMDELDSYCPPFCYFGYHEGDGSALGVWPSFDAIQCAIDEGDAIQCSDLADLDGLAPLYPEACYCVVVNDHGNMTVYPIERTVTVGKAFIEIV